MQLSCSTHRGSCRSESIRDAPPVGDFFAYTAYEVCSDLCQYAVAATTLSVLCCILPARQAQYECTSPQDNNYYRKVFTCGLSIHENWKCVRNPLLARWMPCYFVAANSLKPKKTKSSLRKNEWIHFALPHERYVKTGKRDL
jgi:hypothetical protein